MKCDHCPIPTDRLCLYEVKPTDSTHAQAIKRHDCEKVKAGDRWHNYRIRDQAGLESPPTSAVTRDQVIAIETCLVRKSDCNCLLKPATCGKETPAITVVCTTAGPNGGPCPGVH